MGEGRGGSPGTKGQQTSRETRACKSCKKGSALSQADAYADISSENARASTESALGYRVPDRRRTGPVVPSWIPPDQPLHLSKLARTRVSKEYRDDAIFLNIPYSDQYASLELAIISTVTAYGLVPRMARQRVGLEVRLNKIAEMIVTCRFGFTDLSYHSRMNMPLELGLLLAFGKETFVTSARKYAALRTISDLNFADIPYHGGRIRTLIEHLSRWIEQKCSRKRLSVATLLRRYRHVRRIREELGEDWGKLKAEELPKLLGVLEDEFQMKLNA